MQQIASTSRRREREAIGLLGDRRPPPRGSPAPRRRVAASSTRPSSARRCRGRSRARARSSRAPHHSRRPRRVAHARGDGREQRPADARAAVRRQHEQVLEPDAAGSRGSSRTSGRTARSRPPLPPRSAISASAAGRSPNSASLQLLLGRVQLVLEVLVLGERAEQLEQRRHVLARAPR